MIACPNCQHPNMPGALFCSECGAALGNTSTPAAHPVETGKMHEVRVRKPVTQAAAPAEETLNSWMTLHLMDTGQMLPLAERNEYTLGRISEGQPIMPDIDLSPYQAYARGVSRLHAVIKREGTRVFLMDLGSSNGTYVNGKRLAPHADHALSNGDVVALGKLKIQMLVKAL